MILGIGSDIVSIERVRTLYQKYGQQFLKRILSENEEKSMNALKEDLRINYLARRFSAKEAVSKALGTGISKGIAFTDIEILNYKNGRPKVQLKNKAKDVFENLGAECSKTDIAITITDEPPYAQAMVIISGQSK